MARSDAERIDLIWVRELQPDLRKYTAQIAREALKQEQARGFGMQPIVVTDGRYGAPPESVKWGGKIEFTDPASGVEIAQAILAELRRRSPVLTGRYRDSHVMLLDGRSVESIEELQQRWRRGMTLMIVNIQPYASKIEGADAHSRWRVGSRGKKVGAKGMKVRRAKGISRQAPGGVYRVVSVWAKARFGRAAFITFQATKLNLGVKVWGMSGGAIGGNRSKGIRFRAGRGGRTRIQRDQIYPAIRIRQTESIARGFLN